MIKDIKKLKKLTKLKYESESQMRFAGFTPEELKEATKKQRQKVTKNINTIGWLIVFIVIIPFALIGLDIPREEATMITYFSGVFVFFGVSWIIGEFI